MLLVTNIDNFSVCTAKDPHDQRSRMLQFARNMGVALFGFASKGYLSAVSVLLPLTLCTLSIAVVLHLEV